MSAWHRDSLRWSKNGTPVGWDVPVGSLVRAEIVNANATPEIFRVWRRRPFLTAALVWVKPRPIPLLVAGQTGGIVWSEDLNTGAVRNAAGSQYIFDPGVDEPRSGPLSVIPDTTIKRSGARKVLLSATGKVLHLIGIKFELGADHSRETVYDCTSAADPGVALSVLEAEAAVAHLAQLATQEILEYGDGGIVELDEGQLRQRIRERFRVVDEPPASVSLSGER